METGEARERVEARGGKCRGNMIILFGGESDNP